MAQELPEHVQKFIDSRDYDEENYKTLEEMDSDGEEEEEELETSDEGEEIDVEEEESQVEGEWSAEEYREELERLKRESEGRLNELISQRRENRELKEIKDNIEALQKELIKTKEEEEAIDPEDDPVGYLREDFSRQIQSIREDLKTNQEQVELSRQQEEAANIATAAGEAEQEFAKDHPDYKDAFNFVASAYYNDMLGRGADPEMAQAAIYKLSLDFSKNALMRGENPAEMVYEEAKRLGFKPTKTKAVSKKKLSEKEKNGAKRTSLSNMSGSTDGPVAQGVMTREEFMKNVPKSKRLKILADPTLFKELATTGRIKVPAEYAA